MKTYKIVVSELAIADLQSIVTYISEVESITRAKYVERGIMSEMKRLKYFPAAFPKDEYACMDNWEIRFVMKWHYKILFFIDANTVHITGIFHTAQNPQKLVYL
jgi:plasmid stabilization system protein ParE